jgi:hypothetical protein
MIDIKDGANAHHGSSSFWHKECPLGHSVGTSWHWVPHDDDDDDGKDIDFCFNSESDFCLACQYT